MWEKASKRKLQPTCRRNKKLPKNDMNLNSIPLEEVSTYKYLGLKIDFELNFKTHINGIIKNVANKINIMYKLRKCVTRKALIAIYKQWLSHCWTLVMCSMLVHASHASIGFRSYKIAR